MQSNSPLAKMLNAAQRRFNRARSGSVLILVVALLVLMALIGTAFMTMAQSDRGSSAQHNFNTEADLLLAGAVNIAKGTIVSDLYAAGSYRPQSQGAIYQATTGVGNDRQASVAQYSTTVAVNTGTAWLADRLPSTDALAGQIANVINGNGAYWRFVTAPLLGAQYETPLWQAGGGMYGRDATAPGPYAILPAPLQGTNCNIRWAPTSVPLNGLQYPALQALYPDGTLYGSPILAADTDGDGIADAHFVKMATIDGITYYAAFRIVDNGAAFNVNTAWQADNYGVSNPVGDLFPTNINLMSWLTNFSTTGGTADNINNLITNRFNVTNTNTTFPASPFQDYNNLTLRSDFVFAGGGWYDALWMQLGRRLDNPGLLTSNPSVSFQTLSATEGINLAERFCLRDPSSASYPSFLESQIPNSMGITSPNGPPSSAVPYAVNDPMDWYNQNFAFLPPISGSPNPLPLRSILTARNPVTHFVSNPFNILPTSTASGSLFGDVLKIITPAGPNNSASTRAYVFIGAPGAGPYSLTNLNLSMPAFRWFYVPMPWSTAPTKISAQTGTWGQLMTAYWAVMSDRTTATGVPAGTETRQFYSPLRNPYEQDFGTAGVSRPVPTAAKGSTTLAYQTFLPPSEVIKLRAAIAAVNAIDMRDPDYNVTSERLLLNATVNNISQLVEATVYGNEAQPYITRIYAENDNATAGSTGGGTGAGPGGGAGGAGGGAGGPAKPNPQGYVAVELYNPYPFDIALTSWNLGILQGRVAGAKTTPTYPDMKLVGITGMSAVGLTAQTNLNVTVKAGQYLVLENYPSTGGVGGPKDATYRPSIFTPTATANYCFVSNLSEVMQDPANPTGQPGGELILLRPRKANKTGAGALTCPGLVSNAEYNENNLYDLVPADSFDFTNAVLAAQGSNGPFTGYYYCRPSGASNAWKFVYPGRWDPAYSPLRQEGAKPGPTWTTPGQTDTVMSGIVQQFGTPGVPTYATNNFPPIQLNNTGFAGPFSSAVGMQQYPFGGYTRNLDVLEAPFIGSYRLRRVNGIAANGTLTLTNDPSWLLEMNPVTLDSQQADDYDTGNALGSDDQFENIGRFCPIDGADTLAVNVDDFAPAPRPPAIPTNSLWRYHWAFKLPNYVTAESPQDEQFPLIDGSFPSVSGVPPQGLVHNTSGNTPAPQSYGQVTSAPSASSIFTSVNLNPSATYTNLPIQFLTGGTKGQISTISTISPIPPVNSNMWALTLNAALQSVPAQGDQFVILGPPEETASLNGLVNVNTAPWPVLAGVPMVLSGGTDTGLPTSGFQQNVNIAKSIVYYRDINDSSLVTPPNPPHGHGPFKTLLELNKVPIYFTFPPTQPATYTFRDALVTPGSCQKTSVGSAQGNYTATGGTNTIVGDFQGTFLMANRVSNLLSTHSDSFTAYIEIQGWQNAETTSPVLKVSRRAAIIIDRSTVTPVSQSLGITTVPVN